MYKLNDFVSIGVGLASPDKIREWSHGEVKKPETINYRTLKPEKDGLYCEKIFGPKKDWECHCGKFKKVRFKGIVCDRCGVEITRAKVRRERMGHIELAAPVSHIWYFKGTPSKMGLLLDMSPKALEKILYFASYVVLDPGSNEVIDNTVETAITHLEYKQVLTVREYNEARERFGKDFVAQMGAEAVMKLLQDMDLEKLQAELKAEMVNSSGQKKARIVKRLEVVESFIYSGNKPEWMIMQVIPVIPPDIRPMVQIDGGRFATSDLNDLYRRVINRNNRLKRLIEMKAPEIIVRNEKRMLQEAVDALIDNGRRGRVVTGPGNRSLKSLSEMLKGKQGRFRQNLLGKRVDYSGRSVIVVGPELNMYQCGLPKEMALELFKPFVLRRLVDGGIAFNIKSAKRMIERANSAVWDVLAEVIHDHPVLLNRAPTLHRLGIQAFEPVLVEGRAIKLHPLVCTAYNADFDGDQMAVHVPLSVEAQAEARFLMLASGNLLKPQDGNPVVCPTQDMVIGSYWLTLQRAGEKGEGMIFSSETELMKAYEMRIIDVHARVKMRVTKEWKGEMVSKLVETTPGLIIFNRSIPQDLGYKNRDNFDEAFDLEIDTLVGKNKLGEIVHKCFKRYGATETSIILDKIKKTGFNYSTKAAISIAVSDIVVPERKQEILNAAEEKVLKTEKQYRRGLISDDQRYDIITKTWKATGDSITKELMTVMDKYNTIFMIADSGARGSMKQIAQLGGMRGLMANPSGKIIEIPIKANFSEGLTVLEFFISTHGTRKGLADTALKTADSGYLTRRLVDISQDVIVKEEDCFESRGMEVQGMDVSALMDGDSVIEPLFKRIVGRYTAKPVFHPETGEMIVDANVMISEADANAIIDAGIETVNIRTVFTCACKKGTCARCYGMDLATATRVNYGEAVGIIAAQSIGEPGTQLTMRTFHSGGVAGGDITQGLPRVEELFEARKPKGVAVVTEISGNVNIVFTEGNKRREVNVVSDEGDVRTYHIPYNAELRVQEGDHIEAGDPLTLGSLNPHDILAIKGVAGVRNYILCEVQKVYQQYGIDINDKHIEIIVRQMLRKIKVEEDGTTRLLPGSVVDIHEFDAENQKVIEEGGTPATGRRVLMSITKAALATDSFLSAASFMETTKVLTDASVKGSEDHLAGLKENVLMGKLIPAGTGISYYQDIDIDLNIEETPVQTFEDFMEANEELVGEDDEPAAEEAAIEPVEAVEEEPEFADTIEAFTFEDEE